jgi:hypothetical protein
MLKMSSHRSLGKRHDHCAQGAFLLAAEDAPYHHLNNRRTYIRQNKVKVIQQHYDSYSHSHIFARRPHHVWLNRFVRP